jgi:putative cell wall-binding protein
MHQGISRFRKLAVAAVATVATTAGLLPLAAGGAGATASFDLTRFAGADRYDTAAKISAGSFAAATDVVVTTGENFPDALAGNYLAGTRSAPILLTQKSSVPATTQAEINRLNPQRVWVLGGTDAVAAGGVPTTSGTVTRIGGATRYETAAQAGSTGTVGTLGGAPTAIIATGDKFADALSAGPAAYANNFPLFLTPGAPATALNAATKAALTARGIKHVIIMGGSAAISTAVESEIQAMNITTERAQGADRTETARNFAETILLAKLGFSNSHMNVARGDLFPDALSGGPHAGKEKAPILLTWTSQAATADGGSTTGVLKYASDHASTLTGGHIYGGTDAVSAAVEAQIEAAGGKVAGGGGTSVTSRPELVSASIISTNPSTSSTPGTTVRYCFDEPIAGPQIGAFNVYTSGGVGGPGSDQAGDAAALVSSDNKCVDVRFASVTTSAGAAALTVATVDVNAVNDVGGATNPEGDVPLGTASSTPVSAGVTSAPDLTGVGNFRANTTPGATSATANLVDFTFDQAAFVLTSNTVHLVRSGGSDAEVSNCTVQSGSGTTVLTVGCPNFVTGTTVAPSSTTVARGYVDAGTVSSAATGGTPNVLEAADVTGTSTAPDLTGATLQLDVTSGTVAADRIIYTFDEAITSGTVTDPTKFHAYTAGATPLTGSSLIVNPNNNPNQVAVNFADGTLATAVGAYVDASAVTGFTTTKTNAADEESMANTATVTSTPGRTAGPDLIAVTVSAVRDAFNNVTGAVVSYTFDENLTLGSNATFAKFKAWLADGTELGCTSVNAVSSTAPARQDTVTCTSFGGAALTPTQGQAIVLGTVDDTAVAAADSGPSNPEGAEVATKAGF